MHAHFETKALKDLPIKSNCKVFYYHNSENPKYGIKELIRIFF